LAVQAHKNLSCASKMQTNVSDCC